MTDPFEALFRVGRSSRFSPALDPSWVPQEGEAYPDGMQPSGWIEDGVISDASFASTIDPVLLRTAAQLTGAEAAAYPNRVAFNTDDKKLYRSDGASWTAAVPATDMTGQITTTQITDLAISTPKLAAGAVTAAKITAGTITANEIAADTITAGQIAAGAISATELAAGAVTADKLSVGRGRHLTNPDFESGDTTGWFFAQDGTGGFVSIGTDPLWRAQGLYYGEIAAGTAGTYIAQQVVGIKSGDAVLVSALMANSVSAQLQVLWVDAAGVGISWALPFAGVDTGGGYNGTGPQRKTWKTGAAPAGTVSFNLYVWVFAGGGVLVVDDVWVSRVGDLITPDGNVVIDSSGVTITNGKLTVTNPSSTVIIDGTSNMFKIAASGTLSIAVPAVSGAATSVVLAGLAPGVTAPMLQATGKWDGGATTSGKLSAIIDAQFAWASATSGGATTFKIGQVQLAGYWYTDTNGASNDALVSLYGLNSSGSARTLSGRYYVMREAAL